MSKRKNKAGKYIPKFREKWGDKYKYPKQILHWNTPIKIECPEHGIFEMTPCRHLQQRCHGCTPRGDLYTKFVRKAVNIFGDKFIYDESSYTLSSVKMKITCPKHGEFEQEPASHLRLKHGCPGCGFESSKKHSSYDLDKFLEKAKEVHGDNYDYSEVTYVNSTTKVKIYCNKHKFYFEQEPASHLRGQGCSVCGDDRGTDSRRMSPKDIKRLVSEVYGDRYDYSNVIWTTLDTKVTLICPEHGEFEKTPRYIIYAKTGCPTCSSSKGELCVGHFLDSLNIEYIREYRIPLNSYRYDFYLPKYNLFIEFHGKQHYEYVEFFHRSKEEFNHRKLIDDYKVNLVKVFKGKLIVVHYKLLEKGLVEKFLKRQLIRHGVITSE